MRKFLFLTALVACRSPPDLQVEGMNVYYQGTTNTSSQLAYILPYVKAQGLALAEDAGKGDLFQQDWCAEIFFSQPPLICPETKSQVNGCQAPSPGCFFFIAYNPDVLSGALVYELGHEVWWLTYGNSGETATIVDGGLVVTADPNLSEWVNRVQNELSKKVIQ